MTTITVSTSAGIDLNPATYTSPIVIEGGVTISNPGYPYAIYRDTASTTVFDIQNSGRIIGASTPAGSGSTWRLADRSPTRRPARSPAAAA